MSFFAAGEPLNLDRLSIVCAVILTTVRQRKSLSALNLSLKYLVVIG